MTVSTLTPVSESLSFPRQRTADYQAAREHIHRLRQHGGSYRSIAAAAMVSPTTVYDLASGRRQAQAGTSAAVLAVTSQALQKTRLDAGGARLRLRALHVMGHGSARIARAIGASEKTIRKLVRGETTTIRPQLRDSIVALYEAWWDKRAPEHTRGERWAAASARRRAIAGNWCAAAALDDDLLDAPGYRPRIAGNPRSAPASPPISARPAADARARAQSPGPGCSHEPDHRSDRHDQRPEHPHRPAGA
jgi:hypothetical protein